LIIMAPLCAGTNLWSSAGQCSLFSARRSSEPPRSFSRRHAILARPLDLRVVSVLARVVEGDAIGVDAVCRRRADVAVLEDEAVREHHMHLVLRSGDGVGEALH